jgi:hypothetical protein
MSIDHSRRTAAGTFATLQMRWTHSRGQSLQCRPKSESVGPFPPTICHPHKKTSRLRALRLWM